MILVALLLLATTPQTAVEAERAFAEDAQKSGQWTAFRRWAAADATMFVPKPINAQTWLKERKNPPQAIRWWLTESYVSCDGSVAVNHGGWKRPDGSVGFFSTVWRRQPDGGWKWIVDGGDSLKSALPRPATPKVKKASCAGVKSQEPKPDDSTHGSGLSKDGSLIWEWGFNATGQTRVFSAYLWDGKNYVDVVADLIAVQ